MKCPYRKIIVKDAEKVLIEFGECYGEECPHYGRIERRLVFDECGRKIVEAEYRPHCRKTDSDRAGEGL